MNSTSEQGLNAASGPGLRGPGMYPAMDLAMDLDRSIDLWFREDIGNGDHTSLSTIPEDATGSAHLLVKEPGIIAGLDIALRIFARFDSNLVFSAHARDGNRIVAGDILFRVSGSVRSILQCERLVLNVLQRMSGIATNTRRYVEKLEGTGTRVLDTRKTTPGFRFLEKEAVRIGGGTNHRKGLFDMILIKDNHIDFAGGITPAIQAARNYLRLKKLDLEIEVEVRSLDDVEEVIRTGQIRRILLDNFSTGQTRTAVEMIDHRYETESSGNITLDNIRDYALCGVDYISVGALTHRIRSLDLSLKADF
jgi:nicotinate-nucleotide pyrophosphorylase (carboxylating)